MEQYLQNKKGLVQNVFDQVYDQYDLMNDFMSFGIHRLWKNYDKYDESIIKAEIIRCCLWYGRYSKTLS